MWSSSDHRRCCRRREVTVPCSASWSRCWAASARSSWSRRWAARLQAVRAGASSRPGCSCSPPSASSWSSSTGSGSSARRRSPGPARSTSATSAPSGRWPATPQRSSERRCSGSTPTRGPCPSWRRSGPGSGSTSSPTRCSSTCGTACAAGRSRWSSSRRTSCRSTRSTRPPPPPFPACSRSTGCSRVCRRWWTSGRSTGSRCAGPTWRRARSPGPSSARPRRSSRRSTSRSPSSPRRSRWPSGTG